MDKFNYSSPIGILEIITQGEFLISIKEKAGFDFESKSVFHEKIKQELNEYFLKKRKTFSIPIKFEGTTYQKSVWESLLKIPYGKTNTYKEIAQKIGNINSQRAVGLACNKNPILIIVPCHRVVGKNNKLTGFAIGLDKKKFLLELEATF